MTQENTTREQFHTTKVTRADPKWDGCYPTNNHYVLHCKCCGWSFSRGVLLIAMNHWHMAFNHYRRRIYYA
jgi:hypothetical protein